MDKGRSGMGTGILLLATSCIVRHVATSRQEILAVHSVVLSDRLLKILQVARMIAFTGCIEVVPFTIVERSEACTVFARKSGSCEFLCVCVVLCLGRGLATS
jgi:hypothetical protein